VKDCQNKNNTYIIPACVGTLTCKAATNSGIKNCGIDCGVQPITTKKHKPKK